MPPRKRKTLQDYAQTRREKLLLLPFSAWKCRNRECKRQCSSLKPVKPIKHYNSDADDDFEQTAEEAAAAREEHKREREEMKARHRAMNERTAKRRRKN